MKIIGVTGGIGSGKSIVCNVFRSLGVPVFNADDEAKNIYDTEPEALSRVRDAFGEIVFTHEKLDRKKLAEEVFGNPSLLEKLNNIVHPLVRKRFSEWIGVQQSAYVIREAAILIESGAHKDCDHIVLVSADEATRIKRVKKRNGLTEDDIRKRIDHQWTDDQRRPYCDFEIRNEEDVLILPEIYKIHRLLNSSSS